MKRALPVLLAALGSAVFLWPAGDGLLGNPFAETHNHLWFFARTLLGFRGNAPVGWEVPLMDPPNLAWFALGWQISPAVAWNAVAVANVALACLGGWVLGKTVSGSRSGAFVGMAAVGWSPFLSGVIDFGVTEAYPLGFYALHVAMMERLRRMREEGEADSGPGGESPHALALSAGVTLGVFALSGWYNAAFALVATPVLAWRARSRSLIIVGGSALVLVLPRFLDLLPHLDVWAGRAAALSDPTPIRYWQHQERYGIDLLRFLPSTDTFTPSVSVYLGTILSVLSCLAGRSGWRWLAMALPLWLLALGHWLRVGGGVVGGESPLLMPAGWLVNQFEHARFVTHWYRAAGPATVLLAAAAAIGAARLERRVPAGVLGPLLAVVVLVDGLAFSSTPWPRVASPLPVAPELGLDGPVLDLPVDDNRTPPERFGSRRPYWMWQVTHQQSVAENYEGADSVLRKSGEARALQAACGGLPVSRPGALDSGITDPNSDSVSLFALGFRWVVVHEQLAPAGCVDAVEARFGAPTVQNSGAVGWRIGQAVPG